MTRFGLVLLVVAALAVVPGCGPNADLPDLGEVTGTVTLDGAPLADASVSFEPQGGGTKGSTGTTDETGKYELVFTADAKGAAIGTHSVSIELMPSAENMDEVVDIPSKYNMETELTAEVKAGKNENVNFELTSK